MYLVYLRFFIVMMFWKFSIVLDVFVFIVFWDIVIKLKNIFVFFIIFKRDFFILE